MQWKDTRLVWVGSRKFDSNSRVSATVCHASLFFVVLLFRQKLVVSHLLWPKIKVVGKRSSGDSELLQVLPSDFWIVSTIYLFHFQEFSLSSGHTCQVCKLPLSETRQSMWEFRVEREKLHKVDESWEYRCLAVTLERWKKNSFLSSDIQSQVSRGPLRRLTETNKSCYPPKHRQTCDSRGNILRKSCWALTTRQTCKSIRQKNSGNFTLNQVIYSIYSSQVSAHSADRVFKLQIPKCIRKFSGKFEYTKSAEV